MPSSYVWLAHRSYFWLAPRLSTDRPRPCFAQSFARTASFRTIGHLFPSPPSPPVQPMRLQRHHPMLLQTHLEAAVGPAPSLLTRAPVPRREPARLPLHPQPARHCALVTALCPAKRRQLPLRALAPLPRPQGKHLPASAHWCVVWDTVGASLKEDDWYRGTGGGLFIVKLIWHTRTCCVRVDKRCTRSTRPCAVGAVKQ